MALFGIGTMELETQRVGSQAILVLRRKECFIGKTYVDVSACAGPMKCFSIMSFLVD
jgi:hypothetical protein